MIVDKMVTILCSFLLLALPLSTRGAVGAEEIPTVLPPPHFNIEAASVWKCTHSPAGLLSLQDLQDKGHLFQIEILHSTTTIHDTQVELITPLDSPASLEGLGLLGCVLLGKMGSLVDKELAQSWSNLRHHVEQGQVPLEGAGWREAQAGRDSSTLEIRNGPLGLVDEHQVLRRSLSEGNEERNQEDKPCREGPCPEEGMGPKRRETGAAKHVDDWFSQYHNLSAIYQWYLKLASDYPDSVTLNKAIGKSYYDREIISLHFSKKRREGQTEQRPKIYIQCLLHPREWITGSVCMYLSYRLAKPHPTDLVLSDLLEKVEFVVVPVANPDGYYATWLQYPKYRLWRKNVQPTKDTRCAGVDLNRNFDSHWNAETSSGSSDPCSELYRGYGAESELEVQAITAYVRSLGRLIGAIDFHSYHQKVLYPPAYSSETAGKLDVIRQVAEEVAKSASLNGHTYTSHNMYSLYSAAGTFADWLLDYRNDGGHVDSNHLVPLTMELRPKATDDITYVGFLLPATEILPTCQEMFSALITFSQLVLQESENS